MITLTLLSCRALRVEGGRRRARVPFGATHKGAAAASPTIERYRCSRSHSARSLGTELRRILPAAGFTLKGWTQPVYVE